MAPTRAFAAFALLSSCFALQHNKDHKQADPKFPHPSITVFVFSRVDGADRRAKIRQMWQRAKASPNVDVHYSFAVCGGHDNTINADANVGMELIAHTNAHIAQMNLSRQVGDDGTQYSALDAAKQQELQNELATYQDVLYLPCEEGYGEGALTLKVLASMKYYFVNKKSDYFMKIDDDTFINWARYEQRLIDVGHHYIYMGIEIGEGVPCRNESFRWYEPMSTFSGDLFPKGMSGGSGYTVGQALVDIVIHENVGKEHVLYNEDRSVGVWMDTIDKSGTHVDYIGLNGIDGFWAWDWGNPSENWATWGDYPYVLHHGLEGETIGCLADAADADEGSRPLASCFQAEEGKHYEPLRCAQLNTAAQQIQKQQRAR